VIKIIFGYTKFCCVYTCRLVNQVPNRKLV